MRGPAFAIVLVLLAATAIPFVAGSPVGPPALPSTRIDGDAQFDLAHGVSSGSGTPEDPYVIRGVTFAPGPAHYGLSLRGTRAHVVIDDVEVHGVPADPLFYAHCEAPSLECQVTRLVELSDAQNVTIRGLRTGPGPNSGIGLYVGEGSAHVLVEDSEIAMWAAGYAQGTGIFLADGRDITFRGVRSYGDSSPFWMAHGEAITIEGGRYEGYFFRPTSLSGAGLTVREAELPTGFSIGGTRDVRIMENTFSGRYSQLGVGGSYETFFGYPIRGLVVCGNTFDTPVGSTIAVGGVADVIIAGNVLSGTARPLEISRSDSVEVARNAILGGSTSLFVGVTSLDLHHNDFSLSSRGLRNSSSSGSFAYNWWGDASGPSPIGTGVPATGAAPVSPWLTEPPARDVDCDAIEPPRGAYPPVYEQSFVLPNNPAIIAEIDVPEGEQLSIRIAQRPTPVGDPIGLGFGRAWDRETDALLWQGTYDAAHISGSPDVLVDATVVDPLRLAPGSSFLGFEAWHVCRSACRVSFMTMGGWLHPGPAIVTVHSTQATPNITIDATRPTGLVSVHSMEGVKARAGVLLGTGPTVAHDLRYERAIGEELWAYSVESPVGLTRFLREGPNGNIGAVPPLDVASPPGRYEWRYSAYSPTHTADAFSLWLDADLPDVND